MLATWWVPFPGSHICFHPEIVMIGALWVHLYQLHLEEGFLLGSAGWAGGNPYHPFRPFPRHVVELLPSAAMETTLTRVGKGLAQGRTAQRLRWTGALASDSPPRPWTKHAGCTGHSG